MKHKTIEKYALVALLVLVGCLVLYAFPIEADKSQVTFEDTLLVPAGTYQYATTTVYSPPPPESAQYTASFSVPNGQTVKFTWFLGSSSLQLWQEGQYQPIWIEASEGSWGMSGQSQTGSYDDFYLVVLNQNSAPQDVKVWLSKNWHESNSLSWVVSSTLIALGVGLTPVLMYGKTRFNLKYSALIFAMTFIMIFFLIPTPYWSTPPDPARNLIQAIPGILFFEAFPLIPLLYLLEKHNGFARFQNWNKKQLLKVSGAFILLGYIVPIVFLIFQMLTALTLSSIDPYPANVFSVAISGSIMLTGLLIFTALWTTQRKTTLATMPQPTRT